MDRESKARGTDMFNLLEILWCLIFGHKSEMNIVSRTVYMESCSRCGKVAYGPLAEAEYKKV